MAERGLQVQLKGEGNFSCLQCAELLCCRGLLRKKERKKALVFTGIALVTLYAIAVVLLELGSLLFSELLSCDCLINEGIFFSVVSLALLAPTKGPLLISWTMNTLGNSMCLIKWTSEGCGGKIQNCVTLPSSLRASTLRSDAEESSDWEESQPLAATCQYQIVGYLQMRGLGRIAERFCEELGLEEIDDLVNVEVEEIGQLEWLTPETKKKIVVLVREATVRLSAAESDLSDDDTAPHLQALDSRVSASSSTQPSCQQPSAKRIQTFRERKQSLPELAAGDDDGIDDTFDVVLPRNFLNKFNSIPGFVNSE
jgi:hypothetical protein